MEFFGRSDDRAGTGNVAEFGEEGRVHLGWGKDTTVGGRWGVEAMRQFLMMRVHVQEELFSPEFQQHHIGVFLDTFENNVAAVWRNVEIANVEIGGEVGQLALGARLQVD